MQEAILWYSGAAFGPRTPPFFGCQTRNLSATNQQRSLWLYTKQWICFHLFELGDHQLLKSTQFFTPDRGSLLITLLLGMLYCLPWCYTIILCYAMLTKAWKAIDSLTCVPNFLFSDVYLNLLLSFKSCLLVRSFLSNVVHVYLYINYSHN